MYETEVGCGAALLDREAPGWERRIDLSVLDLAHPNLCVCGQLFVEHVLSKAYESGWLYAVCNLVPGGIGHGHHYGFSIRDESMESVPPQSWEDLTATWTALIKHRFDTGALSDA